MSTYAKAIAGLLLAVSTWGMTAAVEGGIDPVEWFGLLGAVGTAVGVWAVPNHGDESGYSDAVFSAVIAVACTLAMLAITLRYL